MPRERTRIGVVAPGGRIEPRVAERVQTLAADLYPGRLDALVFHPQCFLAAGHFAGDDAARAAAFLEVANDPGFDALWFARGGHGACRIAERVIPKLNGHARAKLYLGYSDAGFLLAGLYRHGFRGLAHAPMPADIERPGGDAAVARALAWLVDRSPAAVEASVSAAVPAAAFNMIVLSQLLGTALQPDLGGHVLMLEEVAEHLYRIDRTLFHITGNAGIRRVAGIRLGRCTRIPPNEPGFGASEEEVMRYWCARSGIPYLGRADIGHDAANMVVPFGHAPAA